MGNIVGAIDRLESALARRSGFGVETNVAVTTLTTDLRCVTEEAGWQTATDVGSSLGGAGSAPTPSALVRAALGSCMAMTYRLRAAKRGVELTRVRVTVEADSSLAGMLVLDADVPPGCTEVRYHVEIESPADAAVIADILAEGDRLSPILDVFVRPIAVTRTVSIGGAEAPVIE